MIVAPVEDRAGMTGLVARRSGGHGRWRTPSPSGHWRWGDAMKTLESKLTDSLNDLVAMVRADLDKITQEINTLLIIDVHARDIVDARERICFECKGVRMGVTVALLLGQGH